MNFLVYKNKQYWKDILYALVLTLFLSIIFILLGADFDKEQMMRALIMSGS